MIGLQVDIKDGAMQCTFAPDRDLAGCDFCFSCLAPVFVVSGGESIQQIAGYSRVRLPDLTQGQPHQLVLKYQDPNMTPANRAWLPLGCFLVAAQGSVLPVTPVPAGVLQLETNWPGWAVPWDGPAPLICPVPVASSQNSEVFNVGRLVYDATELEPVQKWAERMGIWPDQNDGQTLRIRVQKSDQLAPENYEIYRRDTDVILTYADAAGLFYAGVSLVTMIKLQNGQISHDTIKDGPRFSWRGQHLDCARHFFQVDTILDILDLMALFKLNRFHWHFADDETFRVVLNTVPELAKTHMRGLNDVIPPVFGAGIQSGGCYSRQDVQTVLARAHALNIQVVPEIEIPAHSWAIAKIFPQTRDPNDTSDETSVQGYVGNTLNPGMQQTWDVWAKIISEVCDLFPDDVVHLGGDELPPGTWSQSPAVRKLMQEQGITNIENVQGWIMAKVAALVASRGKIPAAWEECSKGQPNIGTDAIIFSWTGQEAGVQAAKQGFRVVMMPAQNTYFDMSHTTSTSDWGARWAATIDLPDTVSWNPVPDGAGDWQKNIIGVEGAFWSEFTTEDAQVFPMLLPRIMGLAMMGWQGQGTCLSRDLCQLAYAYHPVFEARGWQMARPELN